MQYSKIEHTSWFQFLDEGMRDLARESVLLLDMFERMDTLTPFHDYSFVVFPMAKAYEGFLKKWFFRNKFIDERAYQSDHFRIGKALNPSLPDHLKTDWYVYDKVDQQCGDPSLAPLLWKAWKEGRNLTFHFFPNHQYFLSLPEARERIGLLTRAMEKAISCPIKPAGN